MAFWRHGVVRLGRVAHIERRRIGDLWWVRKDLTEACLPVFSEKQTVVEKLRDLTFHTEIQQDSRRARGFLVPVLLAIGLELFG